MNSERSALEYITEGYEAVEISGASTEDYFGRLLEGVEGSNNLNPLAEKDKRKWVGLSESHISQMHGRV